MVSREVPTHSPLLSAQWESQLYVNHREQARRQSETP
jgi:hypothetical protein